MGVYCPEHLPLGQDVKVGDSDDDPDTVQAEASMCICVLVFNKKIKKEESLYSKDIKKEYFCTAVQFVFSQKSQNVFKNCKVIK